MIGLLGYKLVNELGVEVLPSTLGRATVVDAQISESSRVNMIYNGSGFMYMPSNKIKYSTVISIDGEIYTLDSKEAYYNAYQHIGEEVDVIIDGYRNRKGEEQYYIDSILYVAEKNGTPSQKDN